MEYLGLVFELIFLGMGIYVYMFSRKMIRFKDPSFAKRAETFRAENAGWMRLLSLALIAIMSVNVAVHIWQLVQ